MLSVFFWVGAMRLRLFVDFWNYQINWNQRAGQSQCDWTILPAVLAREIQSRLTASGLGQMSLEETRVYASYEPGNPKELKLRNWLHNFLDRQPGVRVFTTERHWRRKDIHCRGCNANISTCPYCNAQLGRASEKAIDALIVTDLVNLAWEGAYDVALLVSSDRDYIPAVELLQRKNFKVINATWAGQGHELARVCWASLSLDTLVPTLVRKP